MKHLKFGFPIFGAMAALIGISACADESPWGNTSKEKGSISLSLTTNSGITTAKPVFRSGEDSRAEDPNDLSTYISVPSSSDFAIKLEKADGSYSKTWTTLADFKTEAASSTFNTGSYTLTAYYGTKGEQDFEKPYFEATSTFTVLSEKTQEVNLEAELKNSMVKINYTDAFKAYMSNYYTTIHTEGRADDITYGMGENRPAFLEPNNANITVHFTTKDKGYTSSVSLGDFPPVAKTLHNIIFDITENPNGDAALKVSFDETLQEEDVVIDLTKELFTTQAPVITCEGFENGETLDMLEGTGSDVILKMNVYAEGQIQSAKLTVESAAYRPAWGSEIDLCQATAEQIQQIQSAGIEAYGFGFTGQPTEESAFLTLTDFGKSLPTGIHTISLVVTDKTGKVSDPAKVILNSEEITIEMVGDPTIVYGSGQAVLTLDYNGTNPDKDISFKAVDANGYYSPARIISCEEITATRAFEKKRYVYTIELPVTTKSNIGIQVFHNVTNKVGDFQVPVTVPKYSIAEYDAFSKYAYLKVTTPESTDPSVLAAVVNNLTVKGNDNDLTIANRDASTGIVTLSGLTPATLYNITSSITGDAWNDNDSFTTESELKIPNGDFSQLKSQNFTSGELMVGGEWHVTLLANKHHTSSFSYTMPSEWANINDLTAWSQAKNRNTWYVVPSSWVDNGIGVMRNVGYNHNGRALENTGKAAGTTYYCTDHPNDNELSKAAGELYLGTYSYNGTESRNEGIGFASRPKSISFDYNYVLDKENHQDEGYALIEIIDTEGNSLGKEVLGLGVGSGSKTVAFNYGAFGKKAAILKVSFKSSNQTTPPIHIPTGNELDEGTGNSSKTLNANTYHAVATGSVLKIDNVVAHYGDAPGSTPVAAPKRQTTKRK